MDAIQDIKNKWRESGNSLLRDFQQNKWLTDSKCILITSRKGRDLWWQSAVWHVTGHRSWTKNLSSAHRHPFRSHFESWSHLNPEGTNYSFTPCQRRMHTRPRRLWAATNGDLHQMPSPSVHTFPQWHLVGQLLRHRGHQIRPFICNRRHGSTGVIGIAPCFTQSAICLIIVTAVTSRAITGTEYSCRMMVEILEALWVIVDRGWWSSLVDRLLSITIKTIGYD